MTVGVGFEDRKDGFVWVEGLEGFEVVKDRRARDSNLVEGSYGGCKERFEIRKHGNIYIFKIY